MKTKIRRVPVALIGLSFAFLFFAVMFFGAKASAAGLADKAVPLSYDQRITGRMGGEEKVYSFSLSKRTYFSATFQMDYKLTDLYVINSGGKMLATSFDFEVGYNDVTGNYTYKLRRCLPAGSYYLVFEKVNYVEHDYVLVAAKETAVSLSRTSITSLKNSGAGKMTVSYSAVKKRTGYQIQYSTNSNMKNAQATCTGAASKSIAKLKKGKTYYVRVRAYHTYKSGAKVYASWSPIQMVNIKK